MLLLRLASPVAAQPAPAASFVGHPIASVAVTIEGRPSEDASLQDAIQTKVGATLSMADVRDSILHLYSFGRFEDVQVSAAPAAGGKVALSYELSPIHVVTRVMFNGDLGLPEGTLRTRMTNRFGPSPSLSRASDVAAALEDLYREFGYLSATVKPAAPILEHEPHRATMVFDVRAGPQTRIARSDVVGNPLESIDTVRDRLRIRPGDPYEPGELQRRLNEYIVWMRGQRRYEAAAHEETPVFNVDRTTVNVTINVSPGPIVRVQFEGDPLPNARIQDLVPIEREGSVDQDLLEDSARRIQDALNDQGFWKAVVNPPEQREQDGDLVIVFHITRGDQYRVAPGGIVVAGNNAVPLTEIDPLFRANRLRPGEPFVESRLTAIENGIKLLYRRKGFVQAEVTSQTETAGPGLARPVITVKEGLRVTIGQVGISGNTSIPTPDLMKGVVIKTGDPYFALTIAASHDALTDAYQNRGFHSVEIRTSPLNPVPSSPGTATSDITFDITEGPQTIVEHVFVSGNVRTRPDVIRRELRFSEGAPLGLDELTESRARLSALGLFRRIQIQQISHGDPSRTDVVVTVEEAPRTTIGYGGGLQIDRILRDNGDGSTSEVYEVGPRGFFEIARRNLGGSNRSIDLYTRVSLRPSTASNNSTSRFTEYRVVATYREPRALGDYADLVGTAAVEQGVRTGFNFSRQGLNAELTRRFSRQVRASLRYSIATTHVFDLDPSLLDYDVSLIDRAFPQVLLSAFSLAVLRDSRDDLLDPQRGALLSVDGTLAARAIGSEVGFTKTFLQGFVYRNLGKPHWVFAGGARLGLANPFPRQIGSVDENGNPVYDANGNPVLITVRELPASERFFAGGSTTVRGYAVDTVGVPATITATGVPLGGDATVILNAELRAPVYGPVAGVLFVDAGNVYPRNSDLDLTNLIGSVGTGVRIKSPIGPIRLDIGFKLNRRIIGGTRESAYAIHFSIGQAF